MNLDKYQQAWKADAARINVTIDTDSLSKEVLRSHRSFQSTIFWRDVREAGVAMFLIPVWLFIGVTKSLPWTWYLTVPALIWIAGFILVDRRWHPQRPSKAGEPLLFYVKESLTQVEHQIWLLRNVFWWYLLPLCVASALFFLDVTYDVSSHWLEFVTESGGLMLFVAVFYGAIYLVNQFAVRKTLEPRRQDLLKLLKSIESEDADEDSGDIMELVTALTQRGDTSLGGKQWADNWNSMYPSWFTVAVIFVPTLVGALCGLVSGLCLQIFDMGPTLFQVVVGAVIPFEIMFFGTMWRSMKKKSSTTSDPEQTASLSKGRDARDESTDESRDESPERLRSRATSTAGKRLPKAPAMVVFAMLLFLSAMAVIAIFSAMSHFRGDSRLRDVHQQNPVTQHGYAKVAPYTGVRWENDRPIVRVQDRWSPLVSINGIPVDQIMEFAKQEHGEKARKRLAEDLVELLSQMGHAPDWNVTLELEQTDGRVISSQVLMTEDNRRRVRD